MSISSTVFKSRPSFNAKHAKRRTVYSHYVSFFLSDNSGIFCLMLLLFLHFTYQPCEGHAGHLFFAQGTGAASDPLFMAMGLWVQKMQPTSPLDNTLS